MILVGRRNKGMGEAIYREDEATWKEEDRRRKKIGRGWAMGRRSSPQEPRLVVLSFAYSFFSTPTHQILGSVWKTAVFAKKEENRKKSHLSYQNVFATKLWSI